MKKFKLFGLLVGAAVLSTVFVVQCGIGTSPSEPAKPTEGGVIVTKPAQ